MLRSATAPLTGIDEFVFKGDTSLSKAYGIIKRFSEDIDVLVVCQQTGQPFKRLLRARHLYDTAMLLNNDRVDEALADGRIAELMIDIDERSAAAGWPFTPRPEPGFATSVAFGGDDVVAVALRDGYARLADLVWGDLPAFDEAIDIVRRRAHVL